MPQVLAPRSRSLPDEGPTRRWLFLVHGMYLVVLAVLAVGLGRPQQLEAQGPPPPLCMPPNCPHYYPIITVTPSLGLSTNSSMISVTITACDTAVVFLKSIKENGIDITRHFQVYTVAACSSGWHEDQANGTISLASGSNTFYIQATGGFYPDTTTITSSYTYAPGATALTVTPTVALFSLGVSASGSATYTVKNTGTGTDTVTLSATCGGTATSCAVSGTNPITLNAGTSQTATVTLTASASTGAGDVRLAANKTSSPIAADTGETDLNVTSLVAHGVQLTSVNPGSLREAGYCLEIAIRRGASVGCGDFRYAHPLPAMKTFNKLRQPVLLYKSQAAHPYFLVPALVTADTSHGSIDSVVVQLKLSGTVLDHVKLAGSSFAHGVTERVLLGADEETAGSGINTIVVTASTYSGSNVTNDSLTGYTQIESAHYAHLGRGFMLAGLEQLKFYGSGDSAGLFWTTGGGDVRYYQPTSTRWYWRTDSLDRRDSLHYDSTALQYTRYAAHGVKVVFDANGRHIKTIDRLNHVTQFAYTNPTGFDIQTITLPDKAGDNTYQYHFYYDSTHSDYIDSVTATPWPTVTGNRRKVTFTQDGSGDIIGITDPDGSTDSLHYWSSAQFQTLVEAFRDKRGTWTTVAYDSGLKVRTAVLDSAGLKLTDTFIALQSRGLNEAMTPDSAYALSIDPRRDTTRFWLDRWGAPLRIRDALADWTLITRGNASYPGLVTRLRHANGQILAATYDARGNLATVTDSSTDIGGAYATTSYQWDGRWDLDTLTTSPLREYTEDHPDTTTGNAGNPLWRQDKRGSVGRIYFSYTQSGCSGLLTSDSLPGTPRDSLRYDTVRCNLLGTKTPNGHWSFFVTDSVGRDTLINTPIDSLDTCTSWTGCSHPRGYQRHTYTIMDRDSLATTTADTLNGAGLQTATVKSFFDLEGNITSVVRKSSPDTTHLDSLRTVTVYDALGRVTGDTDVAGKATLHAYDHAGNDSITTTRRMLKIVSTYDALNRLTMRQDTTVTYALSTVGLPSYTASGDICYSGYVSLHPDACATFADTVGKDTVTFTYDAVGHIVEADNVSAHVSRTYLRNGDLRTETQALRSWTSSSFAQHVYTVMYHYDLDGRRDSLYYPPLIAPHTPSGPARMAYAYDTLSGWLHSVTDALGATYTVGYVPRGDPDTLYFPYFGATELKTWDNDGNLVMDVINSTSGTERSASIRYDGRGKSVRYANQYSPYDTLWARHSGLGLLVADTLHGPFNGGSYVQADRMLYDALGNMWRDSAYNNNPSFESKTISDYRFGVLTGRATLDTNYVGLTADSLQYDNSGNMSYMYALLRCDSLNAPATTTRADYYSAEERLAASDARTVNNLVALNSCVPTSANVYRQREWYRYDAFGRRVLVAALDTADNYSASPNVLYNRKLMRRVVWDGSQVVAEVQVPDSAQSATVTEMDTGRVALALRSDGTDNNRFYGQTLYTFGAGAIDQPLGIVRINNADASDSAGHALPYFQWPAIPFVPLWNVRGRYDTWIAPDYLITAFDDTTHSMTPIPQTGWQGYQLFPPGIQRMWLGTLLEGSQNQTGTVYKRARVYDPLTGRFTQEDPLGLAGGLNAYGFANGDPLNYDDPFGDTVIVVGPRATAAVSRLHSGSAKFRTMFDALNHAPKSKVNILVHEGSEEQVLKFSAGENAVGFTVRYPFTHNGETLVNLAGQSKPGAEDVLTDEFVHEAGNFAPEVGSQTHVPLGCATHGSDVESACGAIRDQIANQMKGSQQQTPPNTP